MGGGGGMGAEGSMENTPIARADLLDGASTADLTRWATDIIRILDWVDYLERGVYADVLLGAGLTSDDNSTRMHFMDVAAFIKDAGSRVRRYVERSEGLRAMLVEKGRCPDTLAARIKTSTMREYSRVDSQSEFAVHERRHVLSLEKWVADIKVPRKRKADE